MTQLVEVPEQSPIAQDAPPKKNNLALFLAREAICLLFWAYAFVEVFVFDLDAYAKAHMASSIRWITDYKVILFLVITAIYVLLTKRFLFAVYFIFYPLILIFYRIPVILFRGGGWAIVLYSVNTTVMFFKSFRYRVVATCSYIVCFSIVFLSNERYVLYSVAIILFVLIGIVLVLRFLNAFRADKLFNIYNKALFWVQGKASESRAAADPPMNLPMTQMNEVQLQKWSNSLQNQLLLNRVFLFAAKKIRDYRTSNLGLAVSLLSLLILWVGVVLTFSAINFALFKADPSFFHAQSPSFFEFFHYSFKASFSSTIDEIKAASELSEAIFMIQTFISFVFAAIFFTTVLAVIKEHSDEQLNALIGTLEAQGAEAEDFIRNHFKLTVEDALAEIERLKGGLIAVLLWLTRNLK